MIGVFCLRFSDIFSVGRWKEVLSRNDNEDQRISALKNAIPEYCLKSKAKNTCKKYKYAFNAFCKWCSSFIPQISPLPASETNVAIYIIHLSTKFHSVAKIQEAVYSISWAHSLGDFKNPCDSTLVNSVKEGAIRSVSHTVKKKEPISPEVLSKLVKKFGKESDSLQDIRLCCMCLIAYAGFLRFSELINLKRSNICIFDSHVSLFIERSKTDVYKEGSTVVISRTPNDTCPVAMLERYLRKANIMPSSEEFIFRSLLYCKKSKSYKLRNGNKPLSYTRAREILLDALKSLGLESGNFGLHSLRSGGATAAASNGITDRLFKKHGRWKSEKAKDGYVQENLLEKLSVSKKLGI